MSAVPNLPEPLLKHNHIRETELENHLNASLNGHRIDSPSQPGYTAFKNNAKEEGFTLHDVPVENQRPIKVIVVGAGYSGIYHGIRIPERLRNCELVIYDKNAGVGGTWFENRYPGCACDIPCKTTLFERTRDVE